jgi:hypothetical protein
MSKKSKDPQISFTTGLAVDDDYLRLAAFRDDIDPYEVDETRMLTYDAQESEEPWNHDDVEMHIISMCIWRNAQGKKRAYVSLSWEGEVEIALQGQSEPTAEFITDAGLHGEWSADHGYVMDVAAIGPTLYVCGDAGQIYRRESNGNWIHFDQGLLLSPEATENTSRCFMAIDGNSEKSIYVAGVDGEIFYFDGKIWKNLPSNTDEQLLCMHIASEEEVYIAGSNGTCLKGNAQIGFKDISSIDDNMRISSITKFQEKIYIASNLGLYIYDPVKSCFQEVNTNLNPALFDASTLQKSPNLLWSIGQKDIASFDGKVWTRLEYPENSKL